MNASNLNTIAQLVTRSSSVWELSLCGQVKAGGSARYELVSGICRDIGKHLTNVN